MSTGYIQTGDVGVILKVTLLDENNSPINLGEATVLQFLIEKPDKTMVTGTGQLVNDGTDGQVFYSTLAGDLNQTGTYRYQVYFEVGPLKKHSDVGKFKVLPNLPL